MVDEIAVGEAIKDFMDSGWIRYLPHNAVSVIASAATLQAEDRTGSLEQVQAFARNGGLAVPAWEPLDAEEASDRLHRGASHAVWNVMKFYAA